MDNKQIVGYIPKLLYKLYLTLKNKFDPPHSISQEEIFCYEICKKLISINDTKITKSPVSNKSYIKNDSLKIFIVIENRMVLIVKNDFRYNIYLDQDKYYYEIIDLINKELDKKILKLEEEIKSNIGYSLKNILSDLSKHTS
jgi:hypothetical protein